MTHWTELRSCEEIEAFQIEFRTWTDDEKAKCLSEMLECVNAFVAAIKEDKPNASTSREERPLLRKRKGRARRIGIEIGKRRT